MKRTFLVLVSAMVLAGSAAMAQEYRREAPPPPYERPHVWVRGERVPVELRGRDHVVFDWRAHHLHRPPSGYVWVRDRDRYLLVGQRTGRIAELAEAR